VEEQVCLSINNSDICSGWLVTSRSKMLPWVCVGSLIIWVSPSSNSVSQRAELRFIERWEAAIGDCLTFKRQFGK
jgi:hypothetical protein